MTTISERKYQDHRFPFFTDKVRNKRKGNIKSDTAKYCQMLPDIPRYCQILPDITKSCQILPDIATYSQIQPDTAADKLRYIPQIESDTAKYELQYSNYQIYTRNRHILSPHVTRLASQTPLQ